MVITNCIENRKIFQKKWVKKEVNTVNAKSKIANK